MSSYKIISADSTGYYEEKKSRFICYLHQVASEEEATAFINSIKKKHYDARHNCSAMVLGPNNELVRSSDDGEPSGTAGKPMLEILLNTHITNVVAVVTRYFGGVLLGTGGLVRAYQAALKDAIANTSILSVEPCMDIEIIINYSDIGAIDYYLSTNSITILSTDYSENVKYTLRIREDNYKMLVDSVTNITNANATINTKSKGYYPI